MDDHKRADKKQRKLTRTPEVSQCDSNVPNVLQLSSSSPTSGNVSPVQPHPPEIHERHIISSSFRNRSSTNVAALNDTSITASSSSLSFSSLLSSSTSFFHHHYHNHHHQQPQQPNNINNIINNNTSNSLHAVKGASTATSVAPDRVISSESLNPEQLQDDDCCHRSRSRCTSAECLKPANSAHLASPSSVSPAIPISGQATTTNTISRGLEYFCGARVVKENSDSGTNTFHKEHYPANNNYLNCNKDTGVPTTNPQKRPNLLKKPEETVSPSSSAFSLKRFSFNRGSKTKRNVGKVETTVPTASPPPSAHPEQPIGRVISHYSDAAFPTSPPPPSSKSTNATTNSFAPKNEDGTIARSFSSRQNKVSTNPFHQHSSSTSSSSMSYQLSTDNVTDIIPACCLKSTPLQLHHPAHPLPVRGTKDSHDSTSDGERSKVGVSVTGMSFVCRNCGTENQVTDERNEVKDAQLLGESATSKHQGQGIVVKDGIFTGTTANSPRTVQIQIKRNCPNQRDPSSDRDSVDCSLAADEYGTFMSTNPFLGDTIIRDDFLKATMRICLVVSPPATKLQIKSRSLNHLDSLSITEKSSQDDKTTPADTIKTTTPSPHRAGSSPAWDGTVNEKEELTSSMLLEGHMQKTTSVSSFPRSPSSVSRGYLSLATSGPGRVSVEASNLSPKNSSFLTSIRTNRKPLLVRSEASSSEYFTLRFEGEDDTYISGKRGVPLGYALGSVLQNRCLSFSQITVTDPIVDPGVPIDENTDVGDLVGRRLFVTENSSSGTTVAGSLKTKSSHHQLQKAASVGSRTKKLYSSGSTEEALESTNPLLSIGGTSSESGRIVKQPSKRWSTFLGIKNPQQTQLCELLNQYAKNGVPQFQQGFNFNHHNLAAALDYLSNSHSSWTAFVNCTGITDPETKIQSAIWELVTTEIYYIHALQTVTDLFLACLKAIQSESLLTDVDQNKLFSNIGEICETNLTFWTMYLFPMVQHSIITGHPMCIDYLVTGFTTFAQLFAPYTKYCAEQSTCQYYCRELNRNNGLFTAYLAWCEAHKKCNRLRLADILVRPMQRLTKYSLLLIAIRKHIHQDDSSAEIMDGMIHSVEHFVCSVNSHLTMRQENERLKGIMARIESYDVVDSINDSLDRMVKSYNNMFDLCGPINGCAISAGRHLFMEGDLKLKDSQGKMDVHCFLLTDILLICKAIAKKGHGTLKVIRQPYLTDKLKINLKENSLHCIYLNEWDMAVAAFTLQCPEAKNWNESISKARRIYSTLKQGVGHGVPDSYASAYNPTSHDLLGVRNSPRSVGSSHSGSVELNESRNISVDFEKTNSLSSEEGSTHGHQGKSKYSQSIIMANNQSNTNFYTFHLNTNPSGAHAIAGAKASKAISASTLDVKQESVLRQSLPNLSLHSVHNSNTLLVPGAGLSGHNNLLSPSHRGISYPPPSPTRATLRRAYAISTSTKNPPLEKTRNITSQNSVIGVPTVPAFSNYGGGREGVSVSTTSTPCQTLLDEYATSPVKESDV